MARSRYHLDGTALRFEEEANAAPSWVVGDPEELKTAVSNVLDNAVKYSRDEVSVTAEISDLERKERGVACAGPGRGVFRREN